MSEDDVKAAIKRIILDQDLDYDTGRIELVEDQRNRKLGLTLYRKDGRPELFPSWEAWQMRPSQFHDELTAQLVLKGDIRRFPTTSTQPDEPIRIAQIVRRKLIEEVVRQKHPNLSSYNRDLVIIQEDSGLSSATTNMLKVEREARPSVRIRINGDHMQLEISRIVKAPGDDRLGMDNVALFDIRCEHGQQPQLFPDKGTATYASVAWWAILLAYSDVPRDH